MDIYMNGRREDFKMFSLALLVSMYGLQLARGQIWQCPKAEETATVIERHISNSTSTTDDEILMDICLNKPEEIENLITDTVVECSWEGTEAEFYTLRRSKQNLIQNCKRICENMKEIQDCSNQIRYDEFIAKHYDTFCRSYSDSLECKNKSLLSATCSIADRLFEKDMDTSIRRVFTYICAPGCDNITDVYNAIQGCISANRMTGCSDLFRFELCISGNTTCKEVWEMVPYFSDKFTSLRNTCPSRTTATPMYSLSTGGSTMRISAKASRNTPTSKTEVTTVLPRAFSKTTKADRISKSTESSDTMNRENTMSADTPSTTTNIASKETAISTNAGNIQSSRSEYIVKTNKNLTPTVTITNFPRRTIVVLSSTPRKEITTSAPHRGQSTSRTKSITNSSSKLRESSTLKWPLALQNRTITSFVFMETSKRRTGESTIQTTTKIWKTTSLETSKRPKTVREKTKADTVSKSTTERSDTNRSIRTKSVQSQSISTDIKSMGSPPPTFNIIQTNDKVSQVPITTLKSGNHARKSTNLSNQDSPPESFGMPALKTTSCFRMMFLSLMVSLRIAFGLI